MNFDPYEGLASGFGGGFEERRKRRRKHSAGATAGWQLAGSSIDLDFANNRYFGGNLTDLLSCSRASSGYVTNGDGTLTYFPPNTLRLGVGSRSVGLRTNIYTQSQTFTGFPAVACTLTNNAVLAPDGTMTGSSLIENSASSQHNLGPPAALTKPAGAITYTMSLYIKPMGVGSPRQVTLIIGNTTFSDYATFYFDGTTGNFVRSVNVGTYVAFVPGPPTVLANGWVRIACTFTASADTTIWPFIELALGGIDNYAGDGVSGEYIWGAQLEVGSVATAYIPTTTVAVTDPGVTAGIGPGLLVEEARTNLFLQSGDISNAAWGTRTSILSMTGNAAVTPDGTTTATLVIPDNVNFKHRFRQPASVLNNTFYSTSIFVKAAGYSKFGMRCSGITGEYATFDLQTGTVIEASTGGSIQQLTNGWYRCTMVQQEIFGAGTELFDFYIMDSGYVSGTPDNYLYVGNQTSGMYFWGGQNEVGSFPTSYIPTTSVAATRAADVVSLIGLADTTIRHAGASHFVSTAAMPLTTNRYMLGSDHGSVGMAILGTGSAGTDVILYDGTVVLHATPGGGLTPANPLKTAMGWNAAGRSIVSANGTVVTNASAQVIDPSSYYLGSDNSVGFVDTYILRVALWNSRLTDAALKAFTA